MNRGFWPIAGQGRGLEGFAQSARPRTYPVVAEWSPALFASGTASTLSTGTVAGSTLVISGTMLHPGAYLHVPYQSSEPNRDEALVIALPSSESAFVVAPVRSKYHDAEHARALGNPRGKASICISPQRTDPTNVASGQNSIAIGQNSRAISIASIALGSTANAAANYAVALGPSTNSTANYGVAIASGANCNGIDAVALGSASYAGAAQAVAVGTGSSAYGLNSICLGQLAEVSLEAAVGIGAFARAKWRNSLAVSMDSRFATAGDQGWYLAQQYTSTTDATGTELRLADTSRLTIPASTALTWQVQIVARQHAGTAGTIGDTAGWTIQGVTRRTAAGNATILGQSTITTYADAGAAAWTAVISADTANQAMIITATGEANKSIRWLAFWKITRIGA